MRAPSSICVHALDRGLDQPADQRRRPVARPLGRFHRGEDGGFERRLVLLEIERDLLVGDLARQRPGEEPRAGGDEHAAPVTMRNQKIASGVNLSASRA